MLLYKLPQKIKKEQKLRINGRFTKSCKVLCKKYLGENLVSKIILELILAKLFLQ